MLDKNGFTRPTYNEIVEQESEKWAQLFGENAQTNPHSVGGIIIRIHSYFLDKLYQLSELIYNSQFVDSAVGTTLDQLGSNVGLTRQPGQVAIGKVRFTGAVGFIIPSGSLVRTPDGLEYMISEDVAIGQDGTGISHYLYANGSGTKYNKANETQAIMVTPSESVTAVTVSEVTGGADQESDESFRARIDLANKTVMPSSPYNGVISAIEKVTGVTAVKIISNDTLVDDAQTNTPAKSIHIYVNGGYKDDIAEAIFTSLAAGIRTVGNQQIEVADIAGGKHQVCFDYPTTKDVYVAVKLVKTMEYPLDGNEQIKKICMDYINGVGMGNTVHYSYLYRLIYDQVPGIQVADIKIGTSRNQMLAQDIELTNVETAQVTSEKVVIS